MIWIVEVWGWRTQMNLASQGKRCVERSERKHFPLVERVSSWWRTWCNSKRSPLWASYFPSPDTCCTGNLSTAHGDPSSAITTCTCSLPLQSPSNGHKAQPMPFPVLLAPPWTFSILVLFPLLCPWKRRFGPYRVGVPVVVTEEAASTPLKSLPIDAACDDGVTLASAKMSLLASNLHFIAALCTSYSFT